MHLAIAKVEQKQREMLVGVTALAHPAGFYFCQDVLTDEVYVIFHQDLHMLTENDIPPRFSERNFKRMAPFIGQALNAWPKPVIIESKLAATTLSRCVQEAITAKRRYKWTDSSVDEARWLSYNAEIGTTQSGARAVTIGPRSALRVPTGEPIVAAPTPNEYEIDNSESTIRNIAMIVANRLINPMPRFFVLDTLPPLRTIIETQYDVVFEPSETQQNKFYIR
jgi:hypothetical protein